MLGKLVINVLALFAADFIVPEFHLHYSATILGFITIAMVAILLGLVNTFIKPIVQLVSLPINLLTMGIFGFIMNVLLLVVLTFTVSIIQPNPPPIQLGDWPPTFGINTLIAAVLGSIVISLVSSILAMLIPDR